MDSASTGGTWDISNADRLGKSEVQLVNIFIEGTAQIIKWEQEGLRLFFSKSNIEKNFRLKKDLGDVIKSSFKLALPY